MEFNQYQTEITEEILIKYPKEVIDDFYEHLNSIPFIQRLVSKERKRAKDMPKMDDGRIIVDLANPHILENMDYFRETAICFQENGYFTPLVVNKSTHSEFMQWFKRELIRCYYGMVRPDDGEWITGEMYFYLNYMVIKQTQVKKDDRGKKYVVRTDDFPEVWEGVYWRFHYIEQARNGGLYNNFMGQMHASEIASRGKGKSYTLAALLSRLFTIGISSESISKRKALIVADNKEYLVKDGTLNKFIDSLDFLNKHSEFPTQKHRDSMTEMNWLAGWKDSNKRLRGSQNEVLGVAISDDPDKARGKRPHPMHCSVLTDKGFIKWEDVKVGTVLYGDDGMPTSVIDIPFVGNDDIFKITLEDGRCTFAGKDHIFDVTRYYNDHNYFVHDNLTVSDIRKRMETEEYYIRNNPPVLFGDYDDEFCYDEYKKWLMKGALRYIPKKYLFGDFDLRYEMFLDIIELYGDSGHFVKTIHKEFINDLLFLARSIGYASYYNEETKYFIMYGKYDFEAGFTAIKSIEFVGNQKCKCVTVDNKSGLYLIDDFIITHNSDLMLVEEFGSFPKFTEWWSTSMPNVQEGAVVFGTMYAVGTGGTEGADFSGALDLISSPESSNIYGIPNVYDKGSTGNKRSIFFYPSYINYKPFYNHDGVSDVVGAMLYELNERHKIKYTSLDPLKITKRKAEFAFTIQDAIMRRDNTIYPVADLNDRINDIDSNTSILSDMYVGYLEQASDGKIIWKPDNSLSPILHFPHKDNKIEGCIYIKSLPETDSSGNVISNRYVSGADPYDDDASNTLSLGSIFIFDLFTDDIVAEYTGRPMFADDFYENCRRLLLFYNAECNYENNKKGIFTYFAKKNCLYLLSDTLEFLRDKDNPKITFGNNSKGTGNYASTKSGGVAAYGRRCLRDYLLKPYTYKKGDEEITVSNLHRIKFRALLQELTLWNTDGNFDRNDAMVMLMLLREDKLRLYGDSSYKDRTDNNDKDYEGNDDFFALNYTSPDSQQTKLQKQLAKLFKQSNIGSEKNIYD